MISTHVCIQPISLILLFLSWLLLSMSFIRPQQLKIGKKTSAGAAAEARSCLRLDDGEEGGKPQPALQRRMGATLGLAVRQREGGKKTQQAQWQ